ncbi:unnamed protein product [Peniophora sp. CBMAI 1063]|nr:unnamed protein product [Peniophora sp. CBMAI 1063]
MTPLPKPNPTSSTRVTVRQLYLSGPVGARRSDIPQAAAVLAQCASQPSSSCAGRRSGEPLRPTPFRICSAIRHASRDRSPPPTIGTDSGSSASW